MELKQNHTQVSIEFWFDKLKKCRPDGLIGDKIHNEVSKKNTKPEEIEFQIPKSLKDTLVKISKANKPNEHVILLSCLIVLMSKYGLDQVLVESALIEPLTKELKEVYFSETPTPESKFKQILESILKQYKESITNLNYDSFKLYQILEANDILFKDIPKIGFLYHDESSELIEKSSIIFIVMPEADELKLRISFNQNKYNASFINVLGKHYIKIIENCLKNVDFSISNINVLSEEEKKKILSLNSQDKFLVEDKNFIDFFEQSEKKSSEKTALFYEDKCISYKELNSRVNKLARFIREKLGEESSCYVGILMSRSDELIIAILATLKAGCAYIPLDPNIPKERLRSIVKESGIKLIIIDDYKLFEKHELNHKKIINVKNDASVIRDFNDENLEIELDKNQLAYVIYTSGSTGTPKGVMITHHSLINFLKSMKKVPGMLETDLLLSLTTFSFDISILEFFLPLFCGATVIITNQESVDDPSKIIKHIEHYRPTIIQTTPSRWNMLLEYGWKGDKSVKVLCGGEKLDRNVGLQLLEKCGSLWNMYGPTETTIWSLLQCIQKDEDINYIGKPIDNTDVYILDSNLSPQPIGVYGEIYIGGVGLAKGYLNDEEQTKEKFIINPFKEGTLLYKTGDIGRYNSIHGEIQFMGRTDNQVKVRGHRIELGEIEYHLSNIPFIKEAVVMIVEHPSNGKELIAYIRKEGKNEILVEDINFYLENFLPYYMLPSHYVEINLFPKTPNGKINRKELVYSLKKEIPGSAEYVEARNDLEKELVEIWQIVLGKEKVGIKDNFFFHGGHSLKANQLLVRYEEKYQVKIEFAKLFSNTTIEKHAELINKAEKIQLDLIPKIPIQKSYILSDSQLRLWVLNQFEENSSVFNIYSYLPLNGKIKFELFEKAIKAVIDRHEILRTVFKPDENEAVKQWVLNTDEINYKLEKIKFDNESNEKLREYVNQQSSYSFNLETGPLFRTSLIELSNQQFIFYYNIHHIICDGWSIDVLLKEIMSFYIHYTDKTPLLLEPLTIQYKDYAVWQKERFKKADFKTHKDYWLNQFAGELPVLDFHGDYARPLVKTSNGHVMSLFLNEKLAGGINKLSQQNNGTLFISLITTINILFYRYTRQDDLIIGYSTAGRIRSELENQIGCYVNTLPLRTRIIQDDDFNSLFNKTKELVLKGFEHEEYHVDSLINDLNLKRNTSRSSLFDVLIILQNPKHKTEDEHVLATDETIEHIFNGTSKFDLTFNFEEIGNKLHLLVEYNSDIYKTESIERLVLNYKLLLESIIENPTEHLLNLDYITKTEKNRLNFDFNPVKLEKKSNLTISQLFEYQAKHCSDKIALVFKTKTFTYKELNEVSNQFAYYLIEKYSIKSDDLIGIKIERSEWLIISILAILKSGGAYVPIDPAYPLDRINYMITDSNCKIVIDENELEKFRGVNDKYGKNDLNLVSKPTDLAYVIYTSGSTGYPKGVMIEHRNVVSIVNSWKTAYELEKFEINLLQLASVSFDVFMGDICRSLLIGGKLVICPNPSRLDDEEFYELLSKHEISILEGTPVILLPLFNYIIKAGLSLKQIKLIIFGSDILNFSALKELKLFFGEGIRIVNSYGTTETTIDSTFYDEELNLMLQRNSNTALIGKPLSNTRIYIVDENNNLLPIGAAGEILIGGEGLARGYLNKDELTSEKFIKTQFEEGLLYKTGDSGRWLWDGNIELLGRLDNQIKIRGYRIEPGEIESALLNYELIQEAIVLVKENLMREKDLVGYFVCKQILTAVEIRFFLSKHLPPHMIPSYFVQLDSMPITPNGKIDRKNFPDPEGLSISSGVEYLSPRNEKENKLVDIWSGILEIPKEKISLKDSFFELGGHSLKATRLNSQIYKEFAIKLNLKDLFTYTTLEDQAKLITDSVKTNYIAIPVVNAQESYLVSAAQRRLWILSQFEDASISYNMPSSFVLNKSYDQTSLEKAIYSVIDRHEILRTVFKADAEGNIRQYVLSLEELDFKMSFIDLRSSANQTEELDKYIKIDSSAIFNLEKGPLLRISLLQMTDDKFVFYYNMHHIITDGWSMDILSKDLFAYYNHYSTGQNIQLPKLKIQYKDYAAWQLSQLHEPEYMAQRAYWLERLSGELPLFNFPTSKRRPELKTSNGHTYGTYFSEEQTLLLKQYAKKNDVTLFMGLVSSLNALFSRYTDDREFLLGTPIAGREHIDLEDQIGFYINTLVLRTYVDTSDTFESLLLKTKQTILDAYANQKYPFDKLVEELNIKKDPSRSSVFDAMIILQNAGNNLYSSENPGLKFTEQIKDYGTGTSKFDVEFNFEEHGNHLFFNITYNTSVYDQEIICGFMKHYKSILSQLLIHPTSSIATIDYLSLTEKEELLEWFNDPGYKYPKEKTIVDLFEEQAMDSSDSIALVYGNKELTYNQLNKYANQLAAYLRTVYDIQPDDRIGIKLEPSEWMVICILAILKSGGAYVPIDVAYPDDRISYILKDSGCKVVIDKVELERYKRNEKKYSNENLRRINKPENLAYIIYTSGSTGQPKGVMIEHRNVVRLFMNEKMLFDFNSNDIWTMFHSYSFDFSVWEMFGALIFGGKLILIPKIIAQDPKSYWEILCLHGVTILNQTPSAFYNLMKEALIDTTSLVQLRYVIFGGEALNPGRLKDWKEKFPEVKLINMYGITETTVHVTYMEITETEIASGMSHIGKAIPTLTSYVLDSNQKLIPVGQSGELYVGGLGLARGYVNNEELTNKRFISNPYKPGEKLYRTGDKVKLLHNGYMEYLGRIDDQVKIRGYRIELGEIENVLQGHQDIECAVVLVKKDSDGEKNLVAYIEGKSILNSKDIRTYLNNRLPSYMVPGYYIQVDRIPLTSNGKIAKNELPDPTGLIMSSGVEFVSPRNELETKLAKIWTEVLKVEKISVKDSFFDLGGDSIKVLRMLTKLRNELEVEIQVVDIYKNSTIEKIANYLSDNDSIISQENERIKKHTDIVLQELHDYKNQIFLSGIEDQENIEDIYLMSDIEKGMIFESVLQEGMGVYHDQMVHLALFVNFDLNLFKLAVELLVEKHPILRTSFNLNDFDKETQIVYKKVDVVISYLDISDRTTEEQEKIVENYLKAEREFLFNFTKAPLWRMKIFGIGNDKYIFIFQCHHAILDGWSDALFKTELNNLYIQLKKSSSFRPEKLKSSYKDFVIQHEVDKRNEETRLFWEIELANCNKLELFTDIQQHETHAKKVNEEYFKKLKEVAAKLNTTVKTVSLAAYIYLLKILNYENTILTGLVTNTRPNCEDGDKILGCFLNTIPFKFEVNGNETCAEFIMGIQQKLVQLKKHERLSVFEISRIHQNQVNRENSFFNEIFNFIDFHIYDTIEESVAIDKESSNDSPDYIIGHSLTNTFFNFTIDITGGDYKIIVDLTKKLKCNYSPAEITDLYFNILSGMIDSPDLKLSLIQCNSPQDQHKLLKEFNNTKTDYPSNDDIVHLFEAQVKASPNNIATVFNERILTYEKLNEYVNQLANYLQTVYNIEANDRVAIKLERSDVMVICILAVLKCRGTYVPIDPNYPQERIEFILKDSNCKNILDENILLDFEKDRVNYDSRNLPKANHVSGLVYIIYTSGSTGRPKGVAVEHKSVVRLVKSTNYISISGFDKILSLSNFSFDGSVFDIFGALLNGASLFIPLQYEMLDPRSLGMIIEKQAISMFFITTSLFNSLVDCDTFKFPNLKHVMFGGEKASANHVSKFRKKYSETNLIHVYGPTENTTFSSYKFMNEMEYNSSDLSIGTPISNTKIYILGKEHQLLPVGIFGEICVGGDGLAKGYLNNPQLTSDKFIKNPFDAKEMLYLTGDFGRIQNDGSIDFLGRMDDQVKIRGYRIELGEIESAMRTYSLIDDLVVIVKKDHSEDNYLVAYFTSIEPVSISNIKSYLNSLLPFYMIPHFFIQVEKLVLNMNGKIDKKNLPDFEQGNIVFDLEFIVPRNEVEKKLVKIWSELLNIKEENISVNHDFFALGGHSLKITRLSIRIHQTFEVKISLRELFENSTIESISSRIEFVLSNKILDKSKVIKTIDI